MSRTQQKTTRNVKPIQIRMEGYRAPPRAFPNPLKFIGDRLTKQFGDRVDVKPVWNVMDIGYRAEDILWLVESGILTLGYQSSSYLTDRVPGVGLRRPAIPVLEERDRARGQWMARSGKFLEQDRGARELPHPRLVREWLPPDFQHACVTIRTPADMKGMSIRVLPSEIQARTFELLGAVPLRWDLTEAIAAIKSRHHRRAGKSLRQHRERTACTSFTTITR